ncbi:hypothetical protein C8R43DRAFT_1122101 [Mycena crocata]|nr:hypothetical protein C8R43DRAFT_1122101 [Mycena crocata]
MPNTRKFIHVSPPTSHIFLKPRLYSTNTSAPTSLDIFTRCRSSNPQDDRFPCVESVLDSAAVQPHIHDIRVVFKHGRRTTHFRVFFKRHVRLPANPNVDVQGDLLVMRVAAQNDESVVNMRGGDQRLADYVAHKIAGQVSRSYA